ncbi:ribbon-helix-helix domain-containing protein [Orenia marismortui]|uniref:Ribbon-helix-helix protein n=1 Tax=Orenia marismortui TaxID=46469 RepID=A0A4R8GE90_9FIRM|nr:ribbon-helix-helix domain-containing protein [Orenia marismortui]TDX43792.1 ribbon-helix-helix protein [Orenia marismortui]
MGNPFEDLKNKVKKPKNNTNLNKEKYMDTKINTKNEEKKIKKEGRNKKESLIKIPDKKSNEKIRRNFYIKKDLDQSLNRLSKQTGTSKSELVDIAVEFLISNYQTG